MGRQIHLYMLREDSNAFLSFIRQDDLVEIVAEASDSPIVRPLEDRDLSKQKNLYLWNRRFVTRFRRTWLPGPQYYGVSVLDWPVLELSGSTLTEWEGKPALIAGRLYGIFDANLGKPRDFQKWYEHLVRWIKKNCHKNPTSMEGYLGSAANELFEKGGYLLPRFLPPRTDTWLEEIGKQHRNPGNSQTGK